MSVAEKLQFRDENYEKHEERAREIIDKTLRPGFEDPCYFIDLQHLRERLALFQDHFLPDDPDNRAVCYAVKANPENAIVETLANAGIDGFDCASIPEIDKILGIKGMGPKNVFYNNPVRTETDVHIALINGVRYFTAQSRGGVDKILRQRLYFRAIDDLEIAVRMETLNPDARIDLSTKFGCTPEEAVRLIRYIKDAGVNAGLAVHTGSQNGNPQTFVDAVNLVKEVAQKSGGISTANYGGGFPVNYQSSAQFDVREYLDKLTRAIIKSRAKMAGKNMGPVRSIIEPGRGMVAPVGRLLSPVIEADSHRGEQRLFINDGLFTSFLSTSIHGWQYEFDVMTEDGRELEGSEEYVLHGRTCDSGDTLGKIRLPRGIREGDRILVRYAGAYMDCQATEFNGFKKAKHVFY